MKLKTLAFRVVEAIVVASALAVLTVRTTQSQAFEEYRKRGGRNGFWSWFAKDKCGIELPGVEDLDEQAENATAEKKAKAKEKKLAALAAREREPVKAEAEAQKRLEAAAKKMLAAKKAATGKKGAGKSGKRSFKGSSGTVKTGGKSSYQPAAPGQMYRVTGIQGIEFGSTDNAPAEGVKPLMSVSYDADGNAEFRQLKWRESRKLSDPIYGFNNALLDHTYESGQLSRVTLTKSFPLNEQGMQQAMEFYASMSDQASADLGFEIVDVDRTGYEKSPRICEFRNKEGETAISGQVNVWNDKHVTVSLSVDDAGYSKMARQQARDAYDLGDPGLSDARIEVWGRDYSDQKAIANELLGK